MSFLKKKNNAKTTLNGAITSGATSLIVVSASRFPTSGDFLLTLWNKATYPDPSDDPNMEIVKVTAVSGTTFTITRAQEFTSGVAHSSGHAAEMLFTAGMMEELETQIYSWASDVNAGGNSLNDIAELTVNGLSTFNDNVGISGTSTLYIGNDAIAWINSPGGDGIELTVHANAQLTLSANTTGVVWVDGVYFGINTAVPRGIFDINNFTSLTVDPPTDASANIQYGSGDYFNEEYSSQFRIYSYRDTVGGRIFSSTYSQTSIVTDNGLADSQYYIQLAWTASANADGYVVVVSDGYNSYSFDYQYTLDGNGTTSSDYMSSDYASDNTLVTPTSYHSGPDLYVASDDGSLNLRGDFNLNGAFTQSNFDIENTFTGPVKITADHAYTGAGNDGILWVVSTNASISATFRLEGATNPKMLWGNTSATTNQKYVQIYIDGSGSLNWGNLNDALSLESSFMKFTRSGITPTGFIIDSGNAGTKSGFGVGSPSARVHIAAGSTSVVPFKLSSGSLKTSPDAGAMEYLTPDLFFTPGSGTRYNLPLVTGAGVQGDIIYASAASVYSRLAKNATATRYLSNTGSSNNPAWAQIDLTNGVTNALPVANGGTGITTSKRLFSHFADANNGTTVETDLYSDTITAGKLASNGDALRAHYGGIFTGAAAATQQLKVYFAGTAIYDSGALSIGIATNYWTVNVVVMRVSSSVVRCDVWVNSDFATLFPYSKYTEITSLTLANTQVLKITGTAAGAGGASNQITAKESYVNYDPI